MNVPYDVFTGAFLSKISEYNFLNMDTLCRMTQTDSYMKRAIASFGVCKYDLRSAYDDCEREFNIDIDENDIDEIVDIVSEGMVVQWLKPFVYQQDLLENVLNTKDFSVYSPAELLLRVSNAYAKSQKDYTQMIREYSYNHGDLSDLHM